MNDKSSYEHLRKRLEEIVVQVRSKDVPLEKSLNLYEEALRIGGRCVEKLEQTDFSSDELAAAGDALLATSLPAVTEPADVRTVEEDTANAGDTTSDIASAAAANNLPSDGSDMAAFADPAGVEPVAGTDPAVDTDLASGRVPAADPAVGLAGDDSDPVGDVDSVTDFSPSSKD
ncbi:MAG: exodeoxyribonuclease VII small subunit [Coriobacteriales bacterium]|nr:exodeoxyribonuclease VII small subunit [Coriobacteriales bacterium]